MLYKPQQMEMFADPDVSFALASAMGSANGLLHCAVGRRKQHTYNADDLPCRYAYISGTLSAVLVLEPVLCPWLCALPTPQRSLDNASCMSAV